MKGTTKDFDVIADFLDYKGVVEYRQSSYKLADALSTALRAASYYMWDNLATADASAAAYNEVWDRSCRISAWALDLHEALRAKAVGDAYIATVVRGGF